MLMSVYQNVLQSYHLMSKNVLRISLLSWTQTLAITQSCISFHFHLTDRNYIGVIKMIPEHH